MHSYILMHIHTHIVTHAHICVHTHTRIYRYIDIYMHTHTRTHIHTYILVVISTCMCSHSNTHVCRHSKISIFSLPTYLTICRLLLSGAISSNGCVWCSTCILSSLWGRGPWAMWL